MALDVLQPQFGYTEAVLLVTDPTHSEIAASYAALLPILKRDYPLRVVTHEITHRDGVPLSDITDQTSAEAYFLGVLAVLKARRQSHEVLHLLVAGGRKAMSIYATLAATLVFGDNDAVYTVLSSPDLLREGLFHAPAGRAHDVQVVRLPVHPSRLLPGTLAELDLHDLVKRPKTAREQFLADLTPEEITLTEMLVAHPYATMNELGKLLGKSPSTIDNQLGRMYIKLEAYFKLGRNKRPVLLDVLNNRI